MPPLSPGLEREIGHAGVHTGYAGELFDLTEDASELRWPESVKMYDRMRRGESKIRAVWRAATLPMRRTHYSIDPNGARDDVVERLSRNIGLPIHGAENPNSQVTGRRRHGRFQFDNHWRMVFHDLIFGHMAFEQVYEIDGEDFGWIKKLAERMPQTIMKISVEADGGLKSIEQWPPGGIGAMAVWHSKKREISVDRLVWYATDKEGGDWQGMSMLRPIYRNWKLRGRFYRVDALTKERNGMGIPVMERTIQQLPTPDEVAAADQVAANLRAGEFSGVQIPFGYRLRLLGVEGSLPSALESAIHHGEEISTGALQGFLDLGRTETGSRALGESFMDFFTMTENTVLADHLDIFNEHVVEDWVDLNWGENEPAPLVVATEIGAEQAPTAEAIRNLIEVGAIKPDKPLRAYLRKTFRMPEEETEPEEQEPTGQTYQYDLDYQIVTIDERRAQIGLAPLPGGKGELPPVAPDERVQVAAANRRRRELGLAALQPATLQRWRRTRAAKMTFRRELFDHEVRAATDFEAIQGQWQSAVASLVGRWKDEVRADQVDELVDQVEALVDAGDIDALGELSATLGPGHALLEEAMQEMADLAAAEALAEAARQGTTITKPATTVLYEGLEKRAVAADSLLGKALSESAGRKALSLAGGSLSASDVAQGVRDHLDSLTDAYLEEQLGGALTSAQNTARVAIMEEGEAEKVYASELLDAATCDNCEAVDGKEYDSIDDATAEYPTGGFAQCLGGPRCRGTLVGIYDAEAEASVE